MRIFAISCLSFSLFWAVFIKRSYPFVCFNLAMFAHAKYKWAPIFWVYAVLPLAVRLSVYLTAAKIMPISKKPEFSYLTFCLITCKPFLLVASGFEVIFAKKILLLFAVFWLFQICQELKCLPNARLALWKGSYIKHNAVKHRGSVEHEWRSKQVTRTVIAFYSAVNYSMIIFCLSAYSIDLVRTPYISLYYLFIFLFL